MMDTLKKGYNIAKYNVKTLNDAGLFKIEHFKMFSIELIKPLNKELLNVPAMQQIFLAQTPELTSGFVFMNALAFWFEVLGSLFGLIFGRPIPLFIFEILYAYAVGYTLYWLVVHALGKDYKRVAIGLYVIYSLINIVQAVGALVLVLPPLFYFLKTCASLSCAYYAFKIRKMAAGATLLTDEDNER